MAVDNKLDSSSRLVTIQLVAQYLLLGWFVAVSVAMEFGASSVLELSKVGTSAILAAQVILIVGLAAYFFKRGRSGRAWLCVILLVLLALTSLTRMLGV